MTYIAPIASMVSNITNHINSNSRDPQGFCDAMSHEHRTLQQSFTRLCIAWLQYVGRDEYLTDARNADTKRLGREINHLINTGGIDPALPLI